MEADLLQSLSFGDRNPQHVLPTVIDYLLNTKKEIIKVQDLQEDWMQKRATWSEWTINLAKAGICAV